MKAWANLVTDWSRWGIHFVRQSLHVPRKIDILQGIDEISTRGWDQGSDSEGSKVGTYTYSTEYITHAIFGIHPKNLRLS